MEFEFAGNVDVKKMHLSMCSEEGTGGREGEGGIVVFLRIGAELRYAPADEIGVRGGGHGREGMEGGGLGGRRWRGKKGLGVFGKVLASVGTVETFWEDDYMGPLRGGFVDLVLGVEEIGGLVRAWDVVLSVMSGWSEMVLGQTAG